MAADSDFVAGPCLEHQGRAPPPGNEDFETSTTAAQPSATPTTPTALPAATPVPSVAPVPTLPPFVPTSPPPGEPERPVRQFRIAPPVPVHSLVFDAVDPFLVPGDQYLVRGGYASGPVHEATTAADSWDALDQPTDEYRRYDEDWQIGPLAHDGAPPAPLTMDAFRQLLDSL